MKHDPETLCRVSADLRRHTRERELAEFNAEQFDETDEDHIGELVCKGLRKPLHRLMQTLCTLETWEPGIAQDKALEQFVKDAKVIREALREEFNNL